MTDVTITIPLELIVSQIARSNLTIGDDEALDLAREVHSIVTLVQELYAAHDSTEAADLSCWIMERPTSVQARSHRARGVADHNE